MFSTRPLMIKYSGRSEYLHILTNTELRDLHGYLAGIYKDVKDYCDSHGLTVMLAYGSALGAYRHQGFIPWDDDIDLFMPRKDYLEFIEGFPKEYGNRYSVTSPLLGGYTTCLFGKVIDRNSKFMTIDSEDNDYCGAYVDIFPLENLPKNGVRRFFMKFLSLAIIYIFGCVLMYRNKSDVYRKFMTSEKDLRANFFLRRSMGFVFSFLSLDKWGRLFDKLVSVKKDTGYIHAPTGDYKWTLRSKDVYFPTGTLTFEGMDSQIPGRIEEYLEIEFGKDYMELPPPEKRWRHPIRSFNIQ